MTKIVALSDTHGMHSQMSPLPKGDVIVHAGDFTNIGSPQDTIQFLKWFNDLEYKARILVAGNHDLLCEDDPKFFKTMLDQFPQITYLQDSGAIIQGINFYGSPFTPKFFDWAFMLERDVIQTKWNKIPSNTDVLITHGPPYGYLDTVFNPRTSEYDEHVGCKELTKAIEKVKPKVHICGHLHDGHGTAKLGTTDIHNVSICTDSYDPIYLPVVIKYKK